MMSQNFALNKVKTSVVTDHDESCCSSSIAEALTSLVKTKLNVIKMVMKLRQIVIILTFIPEIDKRIDRFEKKLKCDRKI